MHKLQAIVGIPQHHLSAEKKLINSKFITQFIQQVLDQIKINCVSPVCIRCGSYFPSLMFCCKKCSCFLFSRYENFRAELCSANYNFVSSLIDWPPDSSESLSIVVHLLKLTSAKSAWSFLARQFVQQLIENIDISALTAENSILVPVPGHKLGSTHTEYFSQAISELLEIPKINLLYAGATSQPTAQKKLTKRQRLSRQSHFYVDFTKLDCLGSVKNVILIDDIVTTGATLVSCVDLIRRDAKLLRHAEIQSWVLFKRTEHGRDPWRSQQVNIP